MTDQWNEKIFENFIQLRDAFRSAKKEKDYLRVLSIGLKIIELEKQAKFLNIITPIFQKDMANASVKLGNVNLAIEYFIAAKTGFKERINGSDDWQKDIDLIDKKLIKLMSIINKNADNIM